MSEVIVEAGAEPKNYRYGWYATGVLMLAYAFSFLDRQILTLMVGPIKADLGISDSEFALLAGAAFGVFYTVMGLPMGWMADHFQRKWLITAGITCWSFMTAASGIARTYPQLFLARIGVAVGEASLSPAVYSLLPDYFDKTRLPRAMSVYTTGLFIGAGTALILGGWIVTMVEQSPHVVLPIVGEMRSWQTVFLIVGLPGLLVALWVSTLREPPRTSMAAKKENDKASIPDVLAYISQNRLVCTSLFLGAAFFSILGYADTWYPELFIRTWGWTPSMAGSVNGTASLVAGPLGLLFAGWMSSHMLKRGQVDACLRLTAFGALAMAVPATLMPLMPHPWLMAALLFPFKFFVGFPPVLIPAALALVAPNRMRAQLGSVFLLTVSILGVTCGPILPAFLNDYVFKDESALGYSLAITAGVTGPIAFAILWMGLKQYRAVYEKFTTPAA